MLIWMPLLMLLMMRVCPLMRMDDNIPAIIVELTAECQIIKCRCCCCYAVFSCGFGGITHTAVNLDDDNDAAVNIPAGNRLDFDASIIIHRLRYKRTVFLRQIYGRWWPPLRNSFTFSIFRTF